MILGCNKSDVPLAPDPDAKFKILRTVFWTTEYYYDQQWLNDWSYHWDFGDHMSLDDTNSGEHTYQSNGTFKIKLTLTNKADGREISHEEVVVADPAGLIKTTVFAPDYLPSSHDVLVYTNGAYYVLGQGAAFLAPLAIGEHLYQYLPASQTLTSLPFPEGGQSLYLFTLTKSFHTQGGVLAAGPWFCFFDPTSTNPDVAIEPMTFVENKAEERCYCMRINGKFWMFLKYGDEILVCKEQ